MIVAVIALGVAAGSWGLFDFPKFSAGRRHEDKRGRKEIMRRVMIMTSMRSRGQVFVEFALVLPVLILIASLVIDLANMVFVFHRLSAATREAARVATETNLPVLSSEIGPTYSESNCPVGGKPHFVPCVAVARADRVLEDSGIPGSSDANTTVAARYYQITSGGDTHTMLEVTVGRQVDYFFKLAGLNIRATANAYAETT